MGTGFLRTERSISVSAALLRQTSTVGVSLSSGEEEDSGPGITEVYLAKKTHLFLFFPPPTRGFCKDERWLRHLGVHLTCGRILGKMS